ncbi:hypothetical protein, partial [Arcanobacterium phocae]
KCEQDIDFAFSSNKLKQIGYTQAIWTLLAVTEDYYYHYTHIKALSSKEIPAFTDSLINWISHPLRICLKESDQSCLKLTKKLIHEHYGLAHEWIKQSKHYWNYCIIFPLWHRGKIDLSVSGDKLIINNFSNFTELKPEYEAYNRLTKNKNRESVFIDSIKEEVVKNTKFNITKKMFDIDFNTNFSSTMIFFWK